MKYLSQRDPQWASTKLGQSKLEMWRWGCTTTCISMISDYFGCYRSPLEIAKDAANYTKSGLVLWQNMSKFFPKMNFEWRAYGFDKKRIDESLKNKDKAVILQVDNKKHWVVALRPTFLGNSYIVLDPWDGKKVDVLKRYANITGSAHFVRE